MPDFTPLGHPKSAARKQIPTILGVVILMVALGVGLVAAKTGLGVFQPRATAQTTPKDIKVSNVADTSFTVSFLTDDATAGFVKYGSTATNLSSQASDDRDQLSGSVGEYTLHHVTVRGLTPSTAYFYVLGTGSQSQFDNQGTPFTITTGPTISTNAATKTIYGNVVLSTGGPANGSIVYMQTPDSGELSALVKDSGSWAIPLNLARTADASQLATITDDTALTITVQGTTENLTTSTQTTVAQAQPVPNLTLGGSSTDTSTQSSTSTTDNTDTTASDSADVNAAATDTTTNTTADSSTSTDTSTTDLTSQADTSLSSTDTTATSSAIIIDLTNTKPQTVSTNQPIITGVVAPNVLVNIVIHSTTQINQQLTSDNTGSFSLDIASIGQNLEPGQHTITYSYVDPTSGQTITKTQTFTVAADATSQTAATDQTLALADVSNVSPLTGGTDTDTTDTTDTTATGPFSSSSPFPVISPSPTPLPSPTPDDSETASDSGIPVATTSGTLPDTGSTGSTFALIIGGMVFVLAGLWSYWVAQRVQADSNSSENDRD